MPTTNKSTRVAKHSNCVANPLTLADIVTFSEIILEEIQNSPYYEVETHDFEISFDDYDAVVRYTVRLKSSLVAEYQGERLYDSHKISEHFNVLSVKHYDGTPHPQMRYALDRILNR